MNDIEKYDKLNVDEKIKLFDFYNFRFSDNRCFNLYYDFEYNHILKNKQHCHSYKQILRQNKFLNVFIRIKKDYDEKCNYKNYDKIKDLDNDIKAFEKINDNSNRKIKKSILEVIIKQYRKVYFDIDKVKFNKNQIKHCIKWLKSHIKMFCCLNYDIDENDIIILKRENKENPHIIKSFHIIFKNLSCHYLDLNFYVKYLKDNFITSTTDELIQTFIKNIDLKVYTMNRQFSLNNTTSFKDEDYNKLVNIDNVELDIEDTLISLTNNTAEIKFEMLYINDIFNNIIEKATEEEKKKEQELINSKKDIKYFDKFNNFFIDIVESDLLDKKLFIEDDFEWKLISRNLIYYHFNKNYKFKSLYDWLFYSAEKSNGIYTFEDNKKWLNTIKDKTNYKYVNTQSNLINTYFNKYLNINCILNPIYKVNHNILKFISKKTNEKYDIVKKTLMKIYDDEINKLNQNTTEFKTPSKIKFKIKNKDYIYMLKTDTNIKSNSNAYLFNITDKETSNYIIEEEYKKDENKLILDTELNFETLEDAKKDIDNFKNDDNKILVVNARWSSGKTHYVVSNLIKHYYNEKKRIIIITQSNSLNIELLDKFKDYEFMSHRKTDILNYNSICSIESIDKIQNYNKNHLLIFDEYESIINHFQSDTLKDKKRHCYKIFSLLIKHSKKIICLDADISKCRIDLLKQINYNYNKINVNVKIINTNYNKFKDYKFNNYLNKNEFETNLIKDCINKNLVIATDTKKYSNEIYKKIIEEIKKQNINKTIIKYNADGLFINKNNEEIIKEEQNKELKKNINNIEKEFIDKYQTNILIYSPSINTGISINKENYFDKQYNHFEGGIINARIAIQMLFRVRNLTDKENNFYIKSKPKITNTITYENIERYIIEPYKYNYKSNLYNFKQSYEENEKNKLSKDIVEELNKDVDFKNLMKTNFYEEQNSKRNFNKQFFLRLIYKHKLKVNHINETFYNKNKQEQLNKDNIKTNKEIKAELKNKLIDDFYKTEIIDKKKYNKLIKIQQINGALPKTEDLKIKKHLLLHNFCLLPTLELENIYIKDDIYIKKKVDTYDKFLKESNILIENKTMFKCFENTRNMKEYYDLTKIYNYITDYKNNPLTNKELQLNKSIENEDDYNEDDYNEENNIFDFEKKIEKKKFYMTIQIINILNLQIDKEINSYTNKDLRKIIKNNIDFFKNDYLEHLENILFNEKAKQYKTFNIDDYDFINFIMMSFKHIFSSYGFKCKYDSKNTKTPNGKFIITSNTDYKFYDDKMKKDLINNGFMTLQDLDRFKDYNKPLIITDRQKETLITLMTNKKAKETNRLIKD